MTPPSTPDLPPSPTRLRRTVRTSWNHTIHFAPEFVRAVPADAGTGSYQPDRLHIMMTCRETWPADGDLAVREVVTGAVWLSGCEVNTRGVVRPDRPVQESLALPPDGSRPLGDFSALISEWILVEVEDARRQATAQMELLT